MGSVDSRDLGLASSATSTTRILGQLLALLLLHLFLQCELEELELRKMIFRFYPQLSRQLSSFAACLSLSGFIFVWSLNRKA